MFQAVLDRLVAHQPWDVDFRNNQHHHSFSPQPASNRGGLNGKELRATQDGVNVGEGDSRIDIIDKCLYRKKWKISLVA